MSAIIIFITHPLWIIAIIFFANLIAAIWTVFREKRDIATTWAWLLVLTLLPIIGFTLYLFAGRKISNEQIFSMKKEQQEQITKLANEQKSLWNKHSLIPSEKTTDTGRALIHFFLESEDAFITQDNQVEIFTDGKEKFESLLRDIKNAKHHIHIEYYSFIADDIGNKILKALEEAAARGVEVRVLYDLFGSHGTTYKFFKHLEELGGYAQAFISASKALISTPRLNYHDHRKLVIIDGNIGYIGGFNIGDQYLGKSPKFGYWRDTHLRIKGFALFEMQARFSMDWNTTCRKTKKPRLDISTKKYMPMDSNEQANGSTRIQIVSSGPDSERQSIKRGYQYIIANAKDYVYIQTPYLIPDDSVLEALIISAKAGTDVRIMIPCMPDHVFVYRATQFYAKYLVENGVEVYQYDNGFLHAKTVVSDDHISSVGSANMDFRSFKLNFEGNAFCYDDKLAKDLKDIFLKDLDNCTELTTEFFDNQSSWLKFKQYFSRLLSPTL